LRFHERRSSAMASFQVFLGLTYPFLPSTWTVWHFRVQVWLLWTFPAHLSLLYLRAVSRWGILSHLYKTKVVIFWSDFIPHIHLTIALSLQVNLAYSSLHRAQHSLAYSMTLRTQAL
jgi:hypothetical protein